MTSTTAVLIPAREKVSLVHLCLDAVLANTTGDFHVYLIDVGYPTELLTELKCRERTTDRLTVVRSRRTPLLANAALNLAFAVSTEPYVCVVENDVVVGENYWAPMLEMLAGGAYDLVSPTIWDGRTGEIHFDPTVSAITPTPDGGYHSELVRRPKGGLPRVPGRRSSHHLEKHSFAGTRAAFQRLMPFDEAVTTRTDMDLSLTAFDRGLRIGLCPDSDVTFYGPPVSELDRGFFSYRWDLERAVAANRHVVGKWKLQTARDYLHFVHEMRKFV